MTRMRMNSFSFPDKSEAYRMSRMWISLLCAASFLQGGASSGASHPFVSLNCTTAPCGPPMTVNCTVKALQTNCNVQDYIWKNSKSTLCERNNVTANDYRCESDDLTYVSLTILSKPLKEENYTVAIRTSCGMAGQSVQVKASCSPRDDTSQNTNKIIVTVAILLSIFAILVVFGILFFWFRTHIRCNQYVDSKLKKVPSDQLCTNSDII